MRRVRRDPGITPRGGQALLRDRRGVVTVDQVMRDPRMVRIFRELGLEDLGRLEIGGVGLVRLGLGAGEIQRVEDLRFVVLRIALGERLVRLGPLSCLERSERFGKSA